MESNTLDSKTIENYNPEIRLDDVQEFEVPHHLQYTMTEQISHGCEVSNLACRLARELGRDQEFCQKMALAGMVHDIGKLPLIQWTKTENKSMVVEELRVIRVHSNLGYLFLMEQGFDPFITEAVRCHHENYDGSGYPANLVGKSIPESARIIRICDVFSALTSDRPYRKGFDWQTALSMMIDEVKNFDLEFFLAFQRMIHREPDTKVALPPVDTILFQMAWNRELL